MMMLMRDEHTNIHQKTAKAVTTPAPTVAQTQVGGGVDDGGCVVIVTVGP